MKKASYGIGVTIFTLIVGTASFGADTKKGTEAKITPEMRQKMADVHQKMADCLRSDRPMSECKQEMMKSCHDTMGKEGCPMMGEMHKHMGNMGGMMGDDSSGSNDSYKEHHSS